MLLGLAVWRGLLEDARAAVGIYYAPSALFAVAFGVRARAAAALLAGHLAPGRPEQGAGPALGLLQQRVEVLERGEAETAERSARTSAAAELELAALSVAGARPSSSSPTTAPTRSAGDAARRCGRSSRADDELVVVDNASRDDTAAAARDALAGADRARAGREPRLRRRLQRGRRRRRPRRCCSSSTPTRCRRRAASTRCAPRRARTRAGARGRRSCSLPGGERGQHARRRRALARLRLGGRAATRRPPTRERAATTTVGFAVGRGAGRAARGVGRGRRLRRPATSCTARTSTCRCGCGSRAGASASAPAARVEHDYEFAKGDYKWFQLERNRWWTVLGAYPARAAGARSRRRCWRSRSRCCCVGVARRLAAGEAARAGRGAARSCPRCCGAAGACRRRGGRPRGVRGGPVATRWTRRTSRRLRRSRGPALQARCSAAYWCARLVRGCPSADDRRWIWLRSHRISCRPSAGGAHHVTQGASPRSHSDRRNRTSRSVSIALPEALVR